eukprot:2931824-Pyramimonas_sp.AAC.1
MAVIVFGSHEITPNPKKGGRALALLPQLVRCWELLHRPRVRSWAKGQEREWDAATQGNSCLREALRRAITDERMGAMEINNSNLLADIEKFYDSLKQYGVLAAALELGFSARIRFMLTAFKQCGKDDCVRSFGKDNWAGSAHS